MIIQTAHDVKKHPGANYKAKRGVTLRIFAFGYSRIFC